FIGAPPPPAMLPPGEPPCFDATLLEAPFPLLLDALADVDQPVTFDERIAGARATTALHLCCTAEAPPGVRLDALLDRLDRLFAAGGVVALLPASQRVIGPTRIALPLSTIARRIYVFVQCRIMRQGGS